MERLTECTTLTPSLPSAADGGITLSFHPSACTDEEERPRCVVVPTHVTHYRHFCRLVEGVNRLVTDPTAAVLIAVLSGDVMGSLAQLCQRCPKSCNGTFEATDLTRLVDLSEEWSRRDHHHHASPLQQPHQERLSSRVSHALGLTRRIEAIRASGIRTSYRGTADVSPGLPDSFFQQAVKKVLGVAHLRCRRVWVVDSESVPFRPFSMRAIFDEYWQDPVVYTATGSTGLEQLTSRQEYLYNQSLALLGIPQGTDWNTTTLHGDNRRLVR